MFKTLFYYFFKPKKSVESELIELRDKLKVNIKNLDVKAHKGEELLKSLKMELEKSRTEFEKVRDLQREYVTKENRELTESEITFALELRGMVEFFEENVKSLTASVRESFQNVVQLGTQYEQIKTRLKFIEINVEINDIRNFITNVNEDTSEIINKINVNLAISDVGIRRPSNSAREEYVNSLKQ